MGHNLAHSKHQTNNSINIQNYNTIKSMLNKYLVLLFWGQSPEPLICVRMLWAGHRRKVSGRAIAHKSLRWEGAGGVPGTERRPRGGGQQPSDGGGKSGREEALEVGEEYGGPSPRRWVWQLHGKRSSALQIPLSWPPPWDVPLLLTIPYPTSLSPGFSGSIEVVFFSIHV